MKRRNVENKRALEQVACTFAAYTRLSGMVPEFQCRELRERRDTLKSYLRRWRRAHSLPCGAQDALGYNLEHASLSFHATLNAMRLIRGRISPQLQNLMLNVVRS